MTENFPNLMREKDTQVQKAQRVPTKMKPKRPTPKNIIIKMAKFQDRENLKGSKGETRGNMQGSSDKASS